MRNITRYRPCNYIKPTVWNFSRLIVIVYTSYGVIGWLPDMDKWAEIISKFLKPGGKFIFVEFHPFIWIFDNSSEHIIYSYFNRKEFEGTIQGSYADQDAPIEYQTVTWNHSLSEVMSSLLKYDIEIKLFQEYDYSVYNCFENTVEFEKGKFRIKNLEDKIPLMYSLVGEKRRTNDFNYKSYRVR